MSNDIEELAIKCGFIPHAHDDGECYASLEDLQRFGEAFAHELTKPQEAVAEVRCRNGEVFGYIGSRVMRDIIQLGTKLYLAPPNYEALQKENEALKHDLDSYIEVANGYVNEVQGLREALDACLLMCDFSSIPAIEKNVREALKKGE